MSFTELRRHRAIAWDFDDTLIGHRSSPLLHAFIRSHRHIRHVIVTFRSHGMQHGVWHDLAAYAAAPEPACFDAILNIPDETYEAFERIFRWREAGLYVGPMTEAERSYLGWKGAVCAQHGLTILIDDNTAHVRLGCDKHEIALFHPDQFV
ncbi:hypothetical protein [Limobrevibacterium gyesilva]|uniref:Uncharacterized protein n=1 Tax=Limobrevibacterium gyesilva TaxID=2991712 RepID=A0AA41YWP6_9PROT|nr:hypothetical protein [Limobrevibacterium gyesilva]MCW3476742.1 hypothetical protein [Limobrevibacterium gyesilva]